MVPEALVASGTDVGRAAAPAAAPAPALPILPAPEARRASYDEAALADAPTRTQPRQGKRPRRRQQAPTERLLTFRDLPSDKRFADLGHGVRAQLEQALEQRRTVDRHEPRLDNNGIPDVELLWRLLNTGFDNQLGNPEDLVPEFAESYYADMYGAGSDYTGVEYNYTTYRGFYDTLLAALFRETDGKIVDKYALASLEISVTRRAHAAERDYGRAGDDDDDDDDDGGRYECTADLVALGLW
jgi:hypothetical protein